MNKRIYTKILKRVITKQMAGLPYVMTALEKRVDEHHTQTLHRINAEVREELDIEDEYLQYIYRTRDRNLYNLTV